MESNSDPKSEIDITLVPEQPLFVISSFSLEKEKGVIARSLASSLARSLYSGSIIIFHNHERPLFRVERKQVDEIMLPRFGAERLFDESPTINRDFLLSMDKHLTVLPDRWVIVAEAAGLALRNIDHLAIPEFPGPYASQGIDFLWTRDSADRQMASPGLWAVRGKHLPGVLAKWAAVCQRRREHGTASAAEIWTTVVQELALKKRPFESGEVIAPRMGAVDWESVSHAAFVTVSGWPKEQQRKFLHALYFGTYLGDDTGLMLEVLDP